MAGLRVLLLAVLLAAFAATPAAAQEGTTGPAESDALTRYDSEATKSMAVEYERNEERAAEIEARVEELEADYDYGAERDRLLDELSEMPSRTEADNALGDARLSDIESAPLPRSGEAKAAKLRRKAESLDALDRWASTSGIDIDSRLYGVLGGGEAEALARTYRKEAGALEVASNSEEVAREKKEAAEEAVPGSGPKPETGDAAVGEPEAAPEAPVAAADGEGTGGLNLGTLALLAAMLLGAGAYGLSLLSRRPWGQKVSGAWKSRFGPMMASFGSAAKPAPVAPGEKPREGRVAKPSGGPSEDAPGGEPEKSDGGQGGADDPLDGLDGVPFEGPEGERATRRNRRDETGSPNAAALEDFDRDLLPPDARRVGSERFEQEVINYYQRQFAAVGGSVALDMDDEKIWVVWSPEEASEDPFEYALTLLERGEFEQAIPLLESLLAANPDDPDLLYNLGMVYSDTGRVEDAVALLSRAVEANPESANSLVALGVAHQRNGEPDRAVEALRNALGLEPENSYAHRNLGGIVASLGNYEEAEPHLREAVRLAPDDQQAVYGLAATLHRLGGDARLEEADGLYQRAVEIAPESQVAEIARRARSGMAQESFRETGGGTPRMDAVMYCLDALKRFDAMTPEQVQAVTLEIALLGRQGLDTNDSTPKYSLRSMPGDFTGLQLVSIMYVGFQRVAPGHDVGFDLSDEYRTAQQLFSKGG